MRPSSAPAPVMVTELMADASLILTTISSLWLKQPKFRYAPGVVEPMVMSVESSVSEKETYPEDETFCMASDSIATVLVTVHPCGADDLWQVW